ncbi:MAG TPA: hypothetical protein DCX89_05015 [Saprospirales bacterium]|nr:hypothetical protein [Saprospirales bacterium]HAY71230.1 hypothetical protein [Saprospirales bacterium]
MNYLQDQNGFLPGSERNHLYTDNFFGIFSHFNSAVEQFCRLIETGNKNSVFLAFKNFDPLL